MPQDVLDDLKMVAEILSFPGYQPLIRFYIGQALRKDLEKIESVKASELITSLKKHGLTEDQIKGETSLDPRWRSVHEDGSPFPGETHPAMVTLRTGKPTHDVVMGVHTPAGELQWISINTVPLFTSGKSAPHAVIASFADITARTRGPVSSLMRAMTTSAESFSSK